MSAIGLNNDLSFAGHCSIHNQSARNFTTSGHSNVVGLSCENLFHSSGNSHILSSKLNKITTSGSTNLFQSTANEIRSSGHLQATDCPRLGKIISSGHTSLTRCKEIEEIVASGAFTLDSSKVSGKVIVSGNHPEITDSKIAGHLECSAKIVKISNSTIKQIVVKPYKSSTSFEFFGWKRSTDHNPEQILELSGKNCQIGSVSFVDGAVGKVLLKNGATMPKTDELHW